MNSKESIAMKKIILFSIFAFIAMQSFATSITVDSIQNAGFGTLRQAVFDANPGDTILFSSLINGDTIKLTSGRITLFKNLTIIGNGPDSTILDGAANSRIFEIISSVKVHIKSLKIQNGSSTGEGGGIKSAGEIHLENVNLFSNKATGTGGGISSSGEMHLENVQILSNVTASFGGGIYANFDIVSIRNSVISGNSGKSGGGLYTNSSGAVMTIANSVFSGNKATNEPTQNTAGGGGIYIGSGTVSIANCTVTGNATANNFSLGGGCYISIVSSSVITNTIIAGNTSDFGGSNNANGVDGGYNLIGNIGTYTNVFPNSTLVGTSADPIDPMFLENVPINDSTGGNFILQCSSVAINGGTPDTTGLHLGSVDIEGMARIFNGIIDIGAHESGFVDVINPTAVCRDTTIFVGASGTVTIDSSFIDNNSVDNCSIATIGLSKTSYTCADLGANTVTMTVTDGVGNMGTCMATITVMDTISPIAMCMDTTLFLNANGMITIDSSFIDNGSSDNCSVQTIGLSKTSFTCADLGANAVTVTVTDSSGNMGTCMATITVMDTISPSAMCMDTTVLLNANGMITFDSSFVDNGSSDNCSVQTIGLSKTSFTCADLGANAVTVTVTDSSGNMATCTATVTVMDTISPTAMCMDTTVFLNANGMITIDSSFINNGSADNCSVQTIGLSKTSFTCADLGANTVKMTVTDGVGNMGTCMATVIVMQADSIFVNNTLLSALGQSGTYNAGLIINSDATISSSNTVKFVSGQEINLLNNFQVDEMAQFEAMIGVCGGSN